MVHVVDTAGHQPETFSLTPNAHLARSTPMYRLKDQNQAKKSASFGPLWSAVVESCWTSPTARLTLLYSLLVSSAKKSSKKFSKRV